MAKEEKKEIASEDAANERDVAKVRAAMKSAPKDDEDVPEIAISEPEDDEPEEREDDRPSRSERRANRYREQVDRAEQAERRAKELEDRLSWLERQQRPEPRAPEPPPAPKPNPELGRIRREQDALQTQYENERLSGTLTQERLVEYQRKYRDLTDQATQAAADELVDRKLEQRLAMYRKEAEAAAVREKHADVYDHGKALQWARGYYHQQLAMGRPDTRALFDESMDAARKNFRLSGHGAPSQESKSRFVSSSSNSGGARSAGTSPPATIRMTKEFRRMADAFAPHIKDEAKRHQFWVNKVGRKIVEGK